MKFNPKRGLLGLDFLRDRILALDFQSGIVELR